MSRSKLELVAAVFACISLSIAIAAYVSSHRALQDAKAARADSVYIAPDFSRVSVIHGETGKSLFFTSVPSGDGKRMYQLCVAPGAATVTGESQ